MAAPNPSSHLTCATATAVVVILSTAIAAIAGTPIEPVSESTRTAPPQQFADDDSHGQVLRGRLLVLSHACGGCHGGIDNPSADDWLIGRAGEDDIFHVETFRTWPRNLTPDDETGLGRFTERQIFNALRFGLRPAATPDVDITSAVPGEGNHPAEPSYLAPSMPWVFWRYMTDQELWDIAAYLKRGLAPVRHEVPDSERPRDLWASEFAVEQIGTHVLPPFPTEQEELQRPDKRAEVLRGRKLAASHACSGCHGGGQSPASSAWLVGMRDDSDEFEIGPFRTRPRNLTPHNTMGIGRFSERQLFNALRYGLRPGETADVEITSTIPGEGNYPRHPKYLAPPMPWPEWRHMPDQDLWDIAAYLKYGVKPVRNRVADSEGPPDFWVAEYHDDTYGGYPAPPFPTDQEVGPERIASPGPIESGPESRDGR
jgi:mono/diheme cytochrome c family protein